MLKVIYGFPAESARTNYRYSSVDFLMNISQLLYSQHQCCLFGVCVL